LRRKDFDEQIKKFEEGDTITLHLRGMYDRYAVTGEFMKVDDRGFVYLDKGFAHSYRKIIAIRN